METLSTFLQQSLTVSGPRAVSACHSTRYGNNDVLEGRKQKTVRGSSLKRAAHIETLNASMELENARGSPPPLAADLRSVVSSLSLSLSLNGVPCGAPAANAFLALMGARERFW